MTVTLSEADVARLMTDGSGSARAETVAKIADHFSNYEMSDAERGLAEDIFRTLMKDAEEIVRESLSVRLSQTPPTAWPATSIIASPAAGSWMPRSPVILN